MRETSFLKRHLGLSLPDFVQLSPDKRAAAARAAVPDLNFFFDDGEPLPRRQAPSRTLQQAQSLFEALKQDSGRDGERTLEQRIITDGFLRSECDRDQNVYLGKLFTRTLTHAVPDLIFQPANTSEVGAALRWALVDLVPVTVRGAASTALGGAVPADAGLVLDLSRLDPIEIDAADGSVVVGAGVRFRTLHEKLREHGLALPAYPSNLGGTYAGWYMTGGIGMNAFGKGRAADHVRAADLVLLRGEHVRFHADGRLDVPEGLRRRTLAPGQSDGWFLAHGYAPLKLSDLPGSEGQLGVLTQLTLAVERLPDLAAFLLAFERASDAHAAVEWLKQRVAEGLEPPANLKLLSASHLEEVRQVWREEDAKPWRERPAALSSDAHLPWRNVLAPSHFGVRAAEDFPSGEAYLFVDFLSEQGGRAFAAALASCPGAPRAAGQESARFARDRFRPQQVKRLGPGLLAAEIVLPAANVPAFLPEAERLAHRAGLELDAEVYYLADGAALALAAFLVDHRRGSFALELPLAPALLDLVMERHGGRPYVLGRWQAGYFRRKFPGKEAKRLRSLKHGLDSRRILNRGAFFDMGLRGPLGLLLSAGFAPSIRMVRWLYQAAPGLVRGMRGALAGRAGPAHGRGTSAVETPAPPGGTTPPELATGRALTCVNCGECNSVCPIFHESKVRLPQMLTHLGEALHAGEAIGPTGSTLLDLCMRCGNCEEVCQAGIPHLPLYQVMQRASDRERPHERERHALLLEALRSSPRYFHQFLHARPGGYLKRTPASLPGGVRFVLLRAEDDAGPAATCIHCAACVDVCPTGANQEYQGEDVRWITTEQARCIGCGTCVEVCPANLVNGGQTLRVMEAPTRDWFAAVGEFSAQETP